MSSKEINPHIANLSDKDGTLTFTLTGVTHYFTNALRRAILSDIPCYAFITEPYEKNKATISSNIADMNVEIIKQRLSSIPIIITDLDFPYQNYMVECEVENRTDTIKYVTTADFKIKNTITGKYLSDIDCRNIFPPQSIPFAAASDVTAGYHLFVALKPQLADSNIPGEFIKMHCPISKVKSGDDGKFAVCRCGFGNTRVTGAEYDAALATAVKHMKTENPDATKEQLDIMVKDWEILASKRHFIPNSYDFSIYSFGIYTNRELLALGCNAIITQLAVLKQSSDTAITIASSDTTIQNGFDVFIHTSESAPIDLWAIGYIITDVMRTQFIDKTINYIGCNKFHPEDEHIVIRIGYIEPVEPGTVIQHIMECANVCGEIFKEIGAQIT